MTERRTRPAGPGSAANDDEAPGQGFPAGNPADAGSASQGQSPNETAPERAEQELERQLETGEENPT